MAWKGCIPCLMAESTIVLSLANLLAPRLDRKVTDILFLSLIIRIARSEALLSGDTLRLYKHIVRQLLNRISRFLSFFMGLTERLRAWLSS